MMTDYVRQYEAPRFPYELKEAETIRDNFAGSAEVTNGIVRWKSNGAVPPQDILDFWLYLGLPFDHAGSTEVRKAEVCKLIAALRANDLPPSQEDVAEMRAAFGAGTTVVNVITGRRTTL